MSKEETKDLKKFLIPFPDHVKELTLQLRDFIWDLYPDCNELVYDNYNALAIGFAPTDKAGDAFCSLAVYSGYVNFGFNRGSEITDAEKKLKGSGSLYRYMTINEIKDLPKTYIKKLMREAYANALARMEIKGLKQTLKGKTIVKSISEKKRRGKKLQ